MAYKKITEEVLVMSEQEPRYYLDFCTNDEEIIVWGFPNNTGPYGYFDAKEVYEFLKEVYG